MPHRDIASFLVRNTPSMSEVPPDMIPADVITQTEAMAEMFDREIRRKQHLGEAGYTSGPQEWQMNPDVSTMERLQPGNPNFELDLDNPSPESIRRMAI